MDTKQRVWRPVIDSRSVGRPAISALGVLGSLVVHLGVLIPVLWPGYGDGFSQDPDLRPGSKRGVPEASQQSPMMVVFLDPPTEKNRGTEELKSLALSELDLRTTVGAPDPISWAPNLKPIPIEEEPGAAPEAVDGPDHQSQLFGRYEGQITARIQRLWLKPRTPLPGGTFACRVQILQDARGNVQEVTPGLCSGDFHWQQTLVRAIRSASPLPAPPDPAVFSPTLTLAFEAESFAPGRSPEGYERDTPDVIAAAERENSAAGFQQAIQSLRSGRPPKSGVVDLRILGSAPQEDESIAPALQESTSGGPQTRKDGPR